MPPPTVTPLAPPVEASNQVIVRNQSSKALVDYPLQFGRPFLQGELKALPIVFANDVAIATQADVKQRWPDGSVRYAILSMMLDALAPGASLTLKFGEQAEGNDTALTAAQMLEPAFDFEAKMALVANGTTVTASARKMLEEGKFSTWLSGPIATTVILADHSLARAYDVGFDEYRSIRPIFEATFWPKTHQVKVRFIGENSNTTTLQDVRYDLSLSIGSAAPSPFYAQAAVPHYFGTRWTKVAWTPAAAAPETNLVVDYSLPYLAKTQFFPNFDTSKSIPESKLASLASSWASAPKGLYEAGKWTSYMPTTGGRSDIAPYPSQTNLWIRTGDPRAREVALAQADLAGAWPLHLREGAEQSKFDRAGKVAALGLPISLNAHPDLWFPDNNGNAPGLLAAPRIEPKTPWVADGAHQPDPFSPQYILTGDHYYLEEMQLWAAAQAMSYAPGQYGRGVPGYGGMQDQIRGNAWVLRNRANAAFLSPDGSAEKSYFNELVEDAVALWEGQRNIVGTTLATHPQWSYGRTTIPLEISPLRFYSRGFGINANDLQGFDMATTSRLEALWESYYFLIELGVVRDQGFAVGPFLQWYAPLLNGQFSDPGYDPILLGNYRTPVVDQNGKFFQTWAAIAQAIPAATYTARKADWMSGSNYYPLLAAGAAASTYSQAGGDVAWAWLDTNVRAVSQSVFADSYHSWDLLPRPLGTVPLPAPTP